MKGLRGLLLIAGTVVAVALFWAWRHPKSAPPPAPAPSGSPTQSNRPSSTKAAESSVTPPVENLTGASDQDLARVARERAASGASTAEVQAVLALLAQRNPTLALDLALQLGRNDDEKYTWVSHLLGGWAKRDAASAWAWTQAPGREFAVQGGAPLPVVVLTAVAIDDPATAVSLAEAALLIAPPHAQTAQFAITALLDAGRPELARETLERWIRVDETRRRVDNAALEKLVLDWSTRSRSEAADWLRMLPEFEAKSLAVATLAASWAEKEPAAAMQWAGALQENEGRDPAMQRVFNRWAAADMPAAAQWIAANENHPRADALIASMVGDSDLPRSNPELALKWAALIAEPETRTSHEDLIILKWSDRNRDAALHYVVSSAALSPERREKLMTAIRTRPPARDGD